MDPHTDASEWGQRLPDLACGSLLETRRVREEYADEIGTSQSPLKKKKKLFA